MSEVSSYDPSNLQERFVEPAGLLRAQGKMAEAIVLLQEGLAEYPDQPKLILKLGEAHLRAGNKASAHECFESIVALGDSREKSMALEQLSRMAAEDSDFELARRYIGNLFHIMPRHLGAISLLGRMALEEGNLEETRRHFEHLAEIHTEGRKAQRVVELFSEKNGDIEALRQKIRDVLDNKVPGIQKQQPKPQPKQKSEELETANDYAALAKKLKDAGRIDTALALLSQAAALFPDDEQLVMSQISCHRAAGNEEEAKKMLEQILEKNPCSIPALQISIQIAEEEGDREITLMRTRVLLEIDRTNILARKRLADFGETLSLEIPQDFVGAAALFRKKGNREKALQILEEGCQKFPKDITILEAIALLYFDAQDFDQSEEYFEKSLELKPGNPQVYFGLAKIALQRGDLRTAKGHLQIAVHAAPKLEAALRQLINIFIEEGNAAEARRYITWLISVSPAAALPTIKHDFFTSLDALDEDACATFTPYDPPSEQLKMTVLHPARSLRDNGQLTEAIACLRANLTHYKNNRYILQELAYCYLDLGNLDQAYKCAVDALVEFPYDNLTLRLLGMIEEAGGAYKRAERFYRKALTVAVDDDPTTKRHLAELIAGDEDE